MVNPSAQVCPTSTYPGGNHPTSNVTIYRSYNPSNLSRSAPQIQVIEMQADHQPTDVFHPKTEPLMSLENREVRQGPTKVYSSTHQVVKSPLASVPSQSNTQFHATMASASAKPAHPNNTPYPSVKAPQSSMPFLKSTRSHHRSSTVIPDLVTSQAARGYIDSNSIRHSNHRNKPDRERICHPSDFFPMADPESSRLIMSMPVHNSIVQNPYLVDYHDRGAPRTELQQYKPTKGPGHSNLPMAPIPSERSKKTSENKVAAIIAAALKVFFVLLTLALSYLIYVKRKTFVPYATRVIEWLKDLKWWGPVVFSIIYAIWTTLLLPGEFLVLASGFTFTTSLDVDYWVGLLVANLAVFGGLWLGGSVIFLVVRYFFPTLWKRKIQSNDVCRATLLALDDGGILFLLLFRASPLMPFAISNIVLGLSTLSYLTWTIGLLGCSPAVLSSTFIGSQLRSIYDLFEEEGEQDHKGVIELCIVVLLPSMLFIIVAFFLVRRRMQEIKGIERGHKFSSSPMVKKMKAGLKAHSNKKSKIGRSASLKTSSLMPISTNQDRMMSGTPDYRFGIPMHKG